MYTHSIMLEILKLEIHLFTKKKTNSGCLEFLLIQGQHILTFLERTSLLLKANFSTNVIKINKFVK